MNFDKLFKEINENADALSGLIDYDDDSQVEQYAQCVADIEELLETIKTIAIRCPTCNELISKESCMQSIDAHAICSSCRREFKLVEA
jgi:DNA-directed RNA polymerase subunit RPC12/RpoP